MAEGDDGREVMRRDAQWPAAQQADDEISLFDLWAVLVRRWWLIVGVTVLTTVLAAAYAASKTDQYDYSLAVEIGSRATPDGELRPIESPDAVVAKLEENYVVRAITQYLEKNPDLSWEPRISASSPEGSGIVVLSASGTTARQDVYQSIFSSALVELKADHSRVIETEEAKLTQEIGQAENSVADAQTDLGRLRAEKGRIDNRAELIRAEISKLEELLQSAEDDRREAVSRVATESQAMTLLMLSSEIRELRQRISELRAQLQVELPSQRDRLQGQIEAKGRYIEERRGAVQVLRTQLANMSKTQALSKMQRSLTPTGAGDAVIVALGVILGLMLGVFAAFFFEFVSRANQHLRDSSGGNA